MWTLSQVQSDNYVKLQRSLNDIKLTIPRCSRMSNLHIGHVLWSNNQGSTQLLWNSCLWNNSNALDNFYSRTEIHNLVFTLSDIWNSSDTMFSRLRLNEDEKIIVQLHFISTFVHISMENHKIMFHIMWARWKQWTKENSCGSRCDGSFYIKCAPKYSIIFFNNW